MKGITKKLSLKKVLYAVLVFVLAMCLVLCSLVTVLRITFFNGSFLSDTLNSSEYYKDLCVELTESLTDLGDASGLKQSFFEGFVNEVLVREDVQQYVSDFYEGKEMKVNTSAFDENLQNALNKYIKSNNIKNVDEEKLDYFRAKASKIYAQNIKIKYLSSLQDLIVDNTYKLDIAIVLLAAVCVAIICVLLFTNQWKHKALRYIFTAVNSAGLFLLIMPILVFVSGIVGRISIISRSLSDMYTSVINTFFSDVLVIAVVLIVISIALWVIHGRIRKKATV